MAPHEDVGSRGSMAAFVWLIVASGIAILLVLSYWFTSKEKKKKEKKPVTVAQLNQEAATRVAGGRRPRRMRVQQQRQDDNDAFNMDNSESDDLLDFEADKPEGKVGKKKQRKLEAKAEKKAERQALIEEREEKNRRELALEAERKKTEEMRLQQEKEQEELERQRKEEQERREHEEYLKLKAEFTIEESGEVGVLTEEESQAMLQEFIDYIKTSKVVLLEDLASQFNLKTQETIERLENLQEMGRITGVMDDRGKFIYISEEELRNVAKFIRQRGRISISDLAESSNTLITLQELEKTNEIESVA